MLVVADRRDDPRDRRARCSLATSRWKSAGKMGPNALWYSGEGGSVHVLLEVQQDVVARRRWRAGCSAGSPTPAGCTPSTRRPWPPAPRASCATRRCRWRRALLLVTITGPPGLAGGVERARPGVQAVRVGRAHHRAVVVVADGEGVGQGVPEREVRHGCSSPSSARRSRGPRTAGEVWVVTKLVHLAAVPARVLGVHSWDRS